MSRGDDDRPRRVRSRSLARSPDLFDRLAHPARPQDDTNGSSRYHTDSSRRSRLDNERAGTSDSSRRGPTKLAPRGRYDESGRRIDDASDTRDRNQASGVPTSPHRHDAGARRERERSSSPTDTDRPHYRAADVDQDSRLRDNRSSRNDRSRISRRSPSPTSAEAYRSRWNSSSDRYDRGDRRRSPPPQSDDRYAPEDSNRRERRWGLRAQVGDRDDDAATSRRRRTPSPSARSDVSNRSRRRDRDVEPLQLPARDRDEEQPSERGPRYRPARWRMDNYDSTDDSPRVRERDTSNGGQRQRSPDAHRARILPRSGRLDQGTAERGHILTRKSGVGATFDGKQPPTGPRQDFEPSQRSVRGGGWQTVRPGSRRKWDAPARDGEPAAGTRNGHESGAVDAEVDSTKSTRAALSVATIEPLRAEPGEAYESIHQVGEGTYGQVFKARAERTGALVALKKIRMDSEKDGFPVTAMREIRLLQALCHDNVVRLHEIMLSRTSVYMVFEYMEHDLNGILAHPQVSFSQAHLKSLAHQLFSGLDYLHRKAVLHRDLKGSNILLNNQGRLKLADFGLARFYAKRRAGDYTNRVVTLWYRPPELLFGATQYGSEVDMWGAGCIFVELFVKKPVFQSETELGQVHAITDILGPVTKKNWPEVDTLAWYEMVKPATEKEEDQERDYVKRAFARYLPASALEVASGLLTYNPRKRWSAKQAMSAVYFEEEPQAELPAGLLSSLQGEWHEYESRRAKKKSSASRGTDNAAVLITAGSTVQNQ